MLPLPPPRQLHDRQRTSALRQHGVELAGLASTGRSTVRHMTLKALIIAILAHISPGANKTAEPAVVDAIVAVGGEATTGELALLTLYAWKESMAQANPIPWSWDAHAHVSCSVWQEPCAFTATHSLADQARYWLRELRTAGLASLDSSSKRAARRQALAEKVLRDAEADLQ